MLGAAACGSDGGGPIIAAMSRTQKKGRPPRGARWFGPGRQLPAEAATPGGGLQARSLLAAVACGLLWVAPPGPAVECRGAEPTLPSDHPAVLRWETEIAELEALSRETADSPAALLFIGSSSVRLWDSIAADMAPWPVIRRGYGGARYRDLCHFASRLVSPHDPRAIVVFVANDITSPAPPPAVEAVMEDVRATHAAIRSVHPDRPVFYVAVTPTESRWKAWPRVRRLNEAIERMTDQKANTFFIPTESHYLDPTAGTPRGELFQHDRLHLNRDGYRILARRIKAAVEAELGGPRDLQPAAAPAA